VSAGRWLSSIPGAQPGTSVDLLHPIWASGDDGLEHRKRRRSVDVSAVPPFRDTVDFRELLHDPVRDLQEVLRLADGDSRHSWSACKKSASFVESGMNSIQLQEYRNGGEDQRGGMPSTTALWRSVQATGRS